ncbi:MAG: B12-binding domain-containing radical SAM protein [Nanoarchaeota archaeon]|nr:B12-binding domain-containing radical SAM protein [Nanoarchaeota archaeon]
MKILFVYSSDEVQSRKKPLKTPEQMHFGISYISSLLKKNNHKTKLIVLSRIFEEKNKKTIDDSLENFCPDVICFTSVSTQYPFIVKMAKYIKKKYPKIFLLIGGPHVSLNPEGVLSEGFDAVCIGEGEYPSLELVSQLEKNKFPSHIKNLWIKKDKKIEKNPPRPFLQNLDQLPFPDRKMWEEWTNNQSYSRYAILLGRGCPFQCAYCCNHAFKKLASGKYTRLRSSNNILDEIKEIKEKFPSEKEIYFEVENFGIDQKWAINLCSKLEEFNKTLKHPLFFGANLRITPNASLENLFIACKKANFKSLNIGLESGSERIRSQILRRNYSNEDIINAVKLARKYELQISLFNMIGLPTETFNDFKETVIVNRKCVPDGHFTSIFFPYPGTDLYSLCKKKGLLKKPLNNKMERSKAVLDLPEFSKKQIQKSYIWFDYYIYKGKKPLGEILLSVLLSEIRSKSILNYLYRRIMDLAFFQWTKKRIKKIMGLR